MSATLRICCLPLAQRHCWWNVPLLTLVLASFSLQAQVPHPVTPAQQGQIDALIGRMTPEQKIDYIGGTGFAVRAVPALNLPAFEMSDGPVGVRSNAGFPSTTYSGGIGLAATWNRALAAKIGAGIGRDARARGVHYMLGPGTNIYRSPRNGRNFEYFGEDPFLAGEMVVGYITGMQEQGVSATVKHFLGNNSEYLRHDSDSIIDERALREIYLPAFEAAVKRGHVGAVMDSYNLINGTHATQNGYFNIDILRKEWGFQGTLMSDWDATYNGIAAANNGLDLEMPRGTFMNRASLLPALPAGTVKQATLDEKVRHILTTAEMFDWLDRPQRDAKISLFDAENNATALQSARESAVLLKNDGNLLPLDRARTKTVLVVGPDAYPNVAVGGGSAGVVPFGNISLLEGVSAVAKGATVLYEPGLPSLGELADRTEFTTAANDGQPGLLEEEFASRDLSGPATSPAALPVLHVNQNGGGWEQPKTPAATSHRFTGFYQARGAGPYLVALAADGENAGNRVFVDGALVIDDWKYVRAVEPHVTLPLAVGPHKIVVESWYGNGRGGRLRLAVLPESEVVSERVKHLAAQADAVVVAAGFSSNRDSGSEGEGGDRTFDLPYGQDALILAMSAANSKTVVTLTSGGNVDSTRWIGKVPALLEGWYGGQASGQALAEILFGDVNPSGHLPATFERRAEDNPTFNNYYPAADQAGKPNPKVLYRESIFVGYRGYEKNHVQPLFPFGFGLSYTSFKFSNLTPAITFSGSVATHSVSFDVTNTGQRAGAAVAQVYLSPPQNGKVPRAAHELKGFERVELAPGETKHITVPLDARAFAYYDVSAKHWTIDPGKFTVSVGDSLASLPLSGALEISREAARTATF